jgi:hypothetical protein
MTVPDPKLLTYEGLARDRARRLAELAALKAENERLRADLERQTILRRQEQVLAAERAFEVVRLRGGLDAATTAETGET